MPPRPAARRLLDLAAVALAASVVLAPALPASRQFGARDNGRMHLPVKSFLAGELARGRFPAWNPYGGLGVPTVSGAVDAPLHPANLLLVLLPIDWAFKAWNALAVVLGGVGAAVLARRLGATEAGARVGAVGFALSGFVLSYTDNLTYLTSAASIPWLLAAARAHAVAGGALRLAGALGASFLLAASGDPVTWAVAAAAVPAIALVPADGAPPLRRRIVRGGLALAAVLAGAAPAVLPVALALPTSSRAVPLAELERLRWNLHPARLAELVLPHLARTVPGALRAPAYEAFFGTAPVPWALSLYAGAAAAALATVAVPARPAARWILALGALAAWGAAGPHLGWSGLAAALPFVGSIRYWERLGVFVALAVAVLAALGTSELLEGPAPRRLAPALAALAAGAFCGAAAMLAAADPLATWLSHGAPAPAAAELVRNVRDGLAHAAAALAALAAWMFLRPRLGRAAPVLVGVVVAADLAAANARAVVPVAVDALRPPQPLAAPLAGSGVVRVVTPIGAGAWPREGETAFEAAARANARLLEGTSGLWARVGNFTPYTALVSDRVLLLHRTLGAERLARIAGRWGVSHVAIPGDPEGAALRLGLEPARVAAIDPVVPAVLFALPSRPRAYLADHVTSVSADGALAFALGPVPPGLASVVEGPAPPVTSKPVGEVRLLRDDPARVELLVTADRPALLVLGDAADPGWTATIDGARAEIVTANFLLRGLWVPAGRHRLIFGYRTPGLAAGTAVAALAACAIAAYAAAERRRRAVPPAPPRAS